MVLDPSLTPLWLTGVFLVGLFIGSFLNVVILRLPRRMEYEWRCECHELLELPMESKEAAPPGFVAGRSHCPKCGHMIRAYENIPVFSWLLLRGKCSSCKSPISARYPAFELLTGLLFLGAAFEFGIGWPLLPALIFTAYLVVLTGIDLDHQLLPDQITLQLLWIGLAVSLTGVWFVAPDEAIMGALVGYLGLWAVYQGFKLLTGKEGMGYGDFKLFAALGAWLGVTALPLIIIVASLVGSVWGILTLAFGKRRGGQPLPFGPFLALGGWIAMVWGQDLVGMYMDFAGLR